MFAHVAHAQDKFTHPGTGIEFYRQVVSSDQTAGGYEWAYALPGAPTGSNDEYIGYIVSYLHYVIGFRMLMLCRKDRLKPAGKDGRV